MKPQAKVMGSYLLSPEVTAIIEVFAQKANISASEAIDRMIIQCSQMVVTGTVEEVTEKDVFEDINKELEAINKKLDGLEEWQNVIYNEVA